MCSEKKVEDAESALKSAEEAVQLMQVQKYNLCGQRRRRWRKGCGK